MITLETLRARNRKNKEHTHILQQITKLEFSILIMVIKKKHTHKKKRWRKQPFRRTHQKLTFQHLPARSY